MTAVILFALKNWRWIAGALLLALAGLLVHAYGRSRYHAGEAAVQAKWDKAKADADAIAAQRTIADAYAAQQASIFYQQEQAHAKPIIQAARQVVVRTVSGPCLDDGVRNAVNAAIAGVPASAPAR